jgi:hypothetical protein
VNKEELLKFIAPVFTALLGYVGVRLQEFRQRRDERYQRSRARAEATEMIEFFDKWIRTAQLIFPPEEFEQTKQIARAQLESVYSSLLVAHDKKRPVEERSFLRRALLLYKPPTAGGWVLHALFYVIGFLMLLESIGVVGVIIDDKKGGPDASPMRDDLIGVLLFYLVLLAVVLGIRAWAASVDRRHGKPQTDGAHATAPALPSQA